MEPEGVRLLLIGSMLCGAGFAVGAALTGWLLVKIWNGLTWLDRRWAERRS